MPVARFPVSLLLAAQAAAPVAAQLRPNRPPRTVQNLPRLLVATPYAANSADSAVAVRVGDGLRQRMDDVAGRWFTVITREQMGETLVRYGYPPDAVLPPGLSRNLASNLQSRFLVSATLGRTPGGRYALQVRAAGINDRAGYAVTLAQAPTQAPEDFGKAAADALADAFKALEDAGKCWDLQLTKPGDAVAAARKALRAQPNHGLAEFCLGEIATARKAPRAEVVAHYQNAVAGDPQSLEAWTKLAQEYIAAEDSANTIKAYQEMLRVAPTNQPLREQAFRVFLNYGRPEAARQVVEEGLAIDSTNAEWWDLKSNACLYLEDFGCAVDALEQAFAADSARADSAFYNKISVAASQRPDTARLLKWARRGADKYPLSPTLLDHLVTAYSHAGPPDSTVAAVHRLMALDSSDVRPALKAIQQLARENRVEDAAAVGAYVERLGEAEMKDAYALDLVNAGLRKLQQAENQDLEGAGALTRQAVRLAVPDGRVAINAHYILGLATAFQLSRLDQPIMDQESCDLARKAQALREESETALTTGSKATDPATLEKYMAIPRGMKDRIESQVKSFCR